MKKRVLHIITRMILGGAQENTLLSCEGLKKHPDFDVTLLTGPAIGPEGELIERARNSGIHTIVLPYLRRELHPWRDIKSFHALLKIIRDINPHIVHTHSSKAGILGRFASYCARVPVTIHTIHGLPYHPYLPWWENQLYILLEKAAARCSDSILCVADAMRKQALAAGVGRSEQYRIVYSGMEIGGYLKAGKERRPWREKLGISPNEIVVTKIARLFELKGHKYVIEAAPDIISKCPEVKFLFVGDGILRPQLEKKVHELGLDDHFIFTGLLPPSDIPFIVAATDILVHASLREGLPRVAVQGLLGGKPVVCFNTDGAPEVVIDNLTGRLIPPKSVRELSEAIIELSQNREKARKMGLKGQKICSQQFSANKMVNDLVKIYNEYCPTKC